MYWRSCTCNTRTVVLGTYAPEGLLAATRADAHVQCWIRASGRAARDEAIYVTQARCPYKSIYSARIAAGVAPPANLPSAAEVEDRDPIHRVIDRTLPPLHDRGCRFEPQRVCEAPALVAARAWTRLGTHTRPHSLRGLGAAGRRRRSEEARRNRWTAAESNVRRVPASVLPEYHECLTARGRHSGRRGSTRTEDAHAWTLAPRADRCGRGDMA